MVGWWSNYSTYESVLDSDPGSTRIVTPATIRVIPAPASAAILSLAVLAASRRRRSVAPSLSGPGQTHACASTT